VAGVSRLTTEKNVWVCTVRADGSPHLTPAWFVYEAETFWICLNGTSVKNRNASHHPTVSLSLEDGNTPVVAEGSVKVHERPYPDWVVSAFFDKFGWNITRDDADDGAYDVLWELPVQRWLMGTPEE
jgi:hypothetical protein